MALREFFPSPYYSEHRYRECSVCGYNQNWATLDFSSGSVAPVVGETLTGATSGNTGVVIETFLSTGTYAGGDAAGRILLSTATGWDRLQYSIFTAGENINGSTGGSNMMTVDSGTIKVNNRLSPEGETVLVDNVRYCLFHYNLRFPIKFLSEAVFDTTSDDDIRSGNV